MENRHGRELQGRVLQGIELQGWVLLSMKLQYSCHPRSYCGTEVIAHGAGNARGTRHETPNMRHEAHGTHHETHGTHHETRGKQETLSTRHETYLQHVLCSRASSSRHLHCCSTCCVSGRAATDTCPTAVRVPSAARQDAIHLLHPAINSI